MADKSKHTPGQTPNKDSGKGTDSSKDKTAPDKKMGKSSKVSGQREEKSTSAKGSEDKMVTFNGADESDEKTMGLQAVFDMYSQAEIASEYGMISLDTAKQWMKEAKVIDHKTGIAEAQVDDAFAKVVPEKTRLSMQNFNEILKHIATERKQNVRKLLEKLAMAGIPTTQKSPNIRLSER